jgi:hypothetical protein
MPSPAAAAIPPQSSFAYPSGLYIIARRFALAMSWCSGADVSTIGSAVQDARFRRRPYAFDLRRRRHRGDCHHPQWTLVMIA